MNKFVWEFPWRKIGTEKMGVVVFLREISIVVIRRAEMNETSGVEWSGVG